MRVAVIGGTGAVGRLAVEVLVGRGDEVGVLSRSASATIPRGATHRAVDLRTGSGLADALRGVDVVLDVANATTRPEELLVAGSRRVGEAAAAAGVGHHVLLSIVGCDRVPLGYYRAKTAQERVVRDGPVPWTLLRATQFHGLVAGAFERVAAVGVRPRLAVPLQPIDPREVARRLADLAHVAPAGRVADLAGPRREDVAALADRWSAHTRRGRIPVRVPAVGPVLRALREGALCPAPDGDLAGPDFAGWLGAADR